MILFFWNTSANGTLDMTRELFGIIYSVGSKSPSQHVSELARFRSSNIPKCSNRSRNFVLRGNANATL